MDIKSTTNSQSVWPPRLFLRRAIAFVLDMTIFQFVLAVLMLVVPLNFGMPLFQTTQCEEVTSGPLVEKVEREWPLSPGQSRENQLCLIHDFLGSEWSSFTTTVASGTAESGFASWRSVSVALDKNGQPQEGVQHVLGPLVGVLLVVLAFALLSADGRRTLGKQLLAIRIVTVQGAPLDFRRALTREVLRFLPWIAMVCLETVISAFSPQSLEGLIHAVRDFDANTAFQMVSGAVLFVFSLVWWSFPLIRWRGQMFYDRVSGCQVRRT